jgi:gliding motility-associated lipoprotein GldH
MQNKPLLKSMLLALMLLSLCACDRQKCYSHYEHLDNGGWERGDTIFFKIPPIKETGVYQIAVNVRSSLSYPYQTLVLNVRKTILPKSESRGHSITCRIYDETGETDNGIAYTQHEFPLDTLSLSQNDSIHIEITHLMRQWQIHGISDIGISLTRR